MPLYFKDNASSNFLESEGRGDTDSKDRPTFCILGAAENCSDRAGIVKVDRPSVLQLCESRPAQFSYYVGIGEATWSTQIAAWSSAMGEVSLFDTYWEKLFSICEDEMTGHGVDWSQCSASHGLPTDAYRLQPTEVKDIYCFANHRGSTLGRSVLFEIWSSQLIYCGTAYIICHYVAAVCKCLLLKSSSMILT